MKKRSKKKFVSVIIALIIIGLLIGLFMVASYQYSTIKVERVTEKFKEQGYDITTSDIVLNTMEYALSLSGVENIADIFVAGKDEEDIIILYFASTDDAEAALTELKDDDKENLGIRGKTVYYGSLNAVKIYKKILF